MNGETAATAMYSRRLHKDKEANKDLQPTIDRIRSGKLFTFRHDGAIYYNNEGKLPNLSNGVYKEYVHPTPGLTRGAGPMRVITGGSKMWFTPDHYHTFIQIKF